MLGIRRSWQWIRITVRKRVVQTAPLCWIARDRAIERTQAFRVEIAAHGPGRTAAGCVAEAGSSVILDSRIAYLVIVTRVWLAVGSVVHDAVTAEVPGQKSLRAVFVTVDAVAAAVVARRPVALAGVHLPAVRIRIARHGRI